MNISEDIYLYFRKEHIKFWIRGSCIHVRGQIFIAGLLVPPCSLVICNFILMIIMIMTRMKARATMVVVMMMMMMMMMMIIIIIIIIII